MHDPPRLGPSSPFPGVLFSKRGPWRKRANGPLGKAKLRQLFDEPAVILAGFKHHHPTFIAARVEVKRDADILDPRTLGGKRARSQQPVVR